MSESKLGEGEGSAADDFLSLLPSLQLCSSPESDVEVLGSPHSRLSRYHQPLRELIGGRFWNGEQVLCNFKWRSITNTTSSNGGKHMKRQEQWRKTHSESLK